MAPKIEEKECKSNKDTRKDNKTERSIGKKRKKNVDQMDSVPTSQEKEANMEQGRERTGSEKKGSQERQETQNKSRATYQLHKTKKEVYMQQQRETLRPIEKSIDTKLRNLIDSVRQPSAGWDAFLGLAEEICCRNGHDPEEKVPASRKQKEIF